MIGEIPAELYEASKAPVFLSEPPFEEPDVPDIQYGGSLVLFGEIASSFGVDVTPKDHQDWRTVLGAAMLLDHLLDNEDQSSEVVDGTSNFVRSFHVAMQGNIRDDLDYVTQVRGINYLASQTPERQQTLYENVLVVDELTRQQRTTTDVHELVDARLAEADILASLLALNYEEGASDAEARKSFNEWVRSWSRVGYTFDSLVDLKEDFENGEISVKPNLLAKAVIAKTVAVEGAVAVKRTPARAVAACAINGFKYVLKQRRPDVLAGANPAPNLSA